MAKVWFVSKRPKGKGGPSGRRMVWVIFTKEWPSSSEASKKICKYKCVLSFQTVVYWILC